jgi:phosphomannomutase/phosphoglucomutase
VYFGCYYKESINAIMVTGSHNPIDYNGFKMMIDSRSTTEDEIMELKDKFIAHRKINSTDKINSSEEATKIDLSEDYVQKIVSDIKLNKKYKVVVDSGNGMGSIIAPMLLKRLGCEVVELFCEVDGNFPNHHPDPSVDKNLLDLQKAIKEHNADIGFAFDGDADRVGVVTKNGNIVSADHILGVLAGKVLEDEKSKGADIIFDVKCSMALNKFIIQKGGNPVMWKTGHSFIKQKMLELKAPIAGELSGHIFFYDRWYGVDDAVYAAARLLEVLDGFADSNKMFDQLQQTHCSPALDLQVSENEKMQIMDTIIKNCKFNGAESINLIDGVRVEYKNGWGLVRASNTTPTLVLRFEADSDKELEEVKNNFLSAIKTSCPSLDLSGIL